MLSESDVISTTTCPLCGGQESTLFDQRIFRSKPVTNRLCSHCGLVYQSPRMSDEELAAFYAEEYRQLYQGSQGPNPKDLAIQKGRAESLLSLAKSQLSQVSSHLDIGCSAGLLLQRFQNEFGCQPVGIEPGNAYRKYAQNQGLRVYETLEALQSSEDTHFDLISLAHVLEHISDPLAYLASLRSYLITENGWLLIEVPNLYAHDSFEIAHLVSYSPHTLSQTLRKAGFEIITLWQHGKPRSQIIPLYLTAMARPESKQDSYLIQPESGVQRKRQWGMLRRRLLTRLLPHQAWLPIPTS